MKNFTYRVSRDRQTIKIYWLGQPVMTLSGHKAADFRSKIARLSDEEVQLLMAKVTGNFKRGNERQAKRHPRNR
ncbi:MAG TPA: hypothetical protein GXZ74_01455 [Tissierellia bacterium]|nr:hypothetical protein [Tissierellia bacterium]